MHRSGSVLLVFLGISTAACAAVLGLPDETPGQGADSGAPTSDAEAGAEAGAPDDKCGPCAEGETCYCGGNILSAPHIYVVFWGFPQAAKSSRAGAIVSHYIEDSAFGGGAGVFGSRFLETITQYDGHESYGLDLAPAGNPQFIKNVDYVEDSSLTIGPNVTAEELRAKAIAVQQQRGGGNSERDAVVVIVRNEPAGDSPLIPQHARVSQPDGCDIAGGADCDRPDLFYIALPNTPATIAADLHRQLVDVITNPTTRDQKAGWRRSVGGALGDIGDQCPNRFITNVFPVTAVSDEPLIIGELWSATANGGKGACVSARATTITTLRVDSRGIVERRAHVDTNTAAGVHWDSDYVWSVFPAGSFTGAPTGVAWGSGRTDVFVHSTNGTMAHGARHTTDTPNGTTDNWDDIWPGQLCASALDSASWGASRLDVFCVGKPAGGLPGRILRRTFDGGTPFQEDIATPSTWNPVSAVAVSEWRSTRWPAHDVFRQHLDIFVMGSDGKLHHGASEDAAATWIWDHGGSGVIPTINGVAIDVVGDPDATGWNEDRVDVVMRMKSGGYIHGSSDDDWAHQAWESLGMPDCPDARLCISADPSITNLGEGRFVVAGTSWSTNAQGPSLWMRTYDDGLGPWIDTLIPATGRIDLTSW